MLHGTHHMKALIVSIAKNQSNLIASAIPPIDEPDSTRSTPSILLALQISVIGRRSRNLRIRWTDSCGKLLFKEEIHNVSGREGLCFHCRDESNSGLKDGSETLLYEDCLGYKMYSRLEAVYIPKSSVWIDWWELGRWAALGIGIPLCHNFPSVR